MKDTHSHSAILSSLEPLIVSGLETKHRTILIGAIRLWNTTFADCEESLDYPPRIKAALLRLRPVANLHLPFFPESAESEASGDHRQPLPFEETHDEASFFEPSRLDSILGREPTSYLGSSRDHNSLPLPGVNKRSREETPDMGSRNTKKRVPTPKLRHDDSQIQFEPIDSSPLVDEAAESQLLTDRQKEVKERQKLDAAMFPDLRSSPRPKTPSSVELPLHRSASKARSLSSPSLARQTTPTLILQAEEDDFVTSSPTPTRANTSEPPSSPSEHATKMQAISYEDESDIPSSPPEMVDDMSNTNTTPLYPSAQIDPYAVETTRTISTYEDTPRESIEPKTSSASAVPIQTGRVTRSVSNIRPVGLDSVSEPGPVAVDTSLVYTNSLSESNNNLVSVQQAQETPVFHDALTSPASSDGHTGNPEVFEDAVTSPRLDMETAAKKKASSPIISDFDESSMLRLVKEYDQGSGRPRRSTRYSTGKENEPDGPLAPTYSPCPAVSSAGPADSFTGDANEATSMHGEETDKVRKGPIRVTGKTSQSSPLPSLIPETPGVRGTVFVTDDGEELDMDETIIVETPDDYEPYTAPRRRRSRALFTRTRNWSASPASKKRKLEETAGAEREVPDNQGVKLEGTNNRALCIVT